MLPQVADGTWAKIYLLHISRVAPAQLPFRLAPAGHPPHSRLAARRLARFAIARTFAIPGIRLIREASGRPRLRVADQTEPGFISISHSGDWVAVAVAERPVAIDVERADPTRLVRAGDGLLRALAERIDSYVPVTAANFYRLWCAHEVAIKLGTDLATLLRAPAGDLVFQQLTLEGGYELAFAIETADATNEPHCC